MFPIKDENPSKRTPIITYIIISLNIAVFTYELISAMEGRIMEFIYSYALVPANVVKGYALHTFLTSMFLHSGFMHVFGNMLYLFIFGDNIEDRLGRIKFIAFYLFCGFVASLAQILANPFSTVPNLGASGAVAGVLGAYLVTFPRARIRSVVILGYFIRWVTLPAAVVLGFWFVVQLFSGVASLPYLTQDIGGVAYFAHVGGFVSGMVLAQFFKRR